MLYYLFQYLDEMNFPGAGLFDYISFRAAMALITSLIVSMLFGKRLIGLLQKQQIGETVRDLGPETHLSKQGTPTMGGTLILSDSYSNIIVCSFRQHLCNNNANRNGLAWCNWIY